MCMYVYIYLCIYLSMYLSMYVCIYLCMVSTYSKSKDQPGKVVNPARGQLNREK